MTQRVRKFDRLKKDAEIIFYNLTGGAGHEIGNNETAVPRQNIGQNGNIGPEKSLKAMKAMQGKDFGPYSI